MTPLGLYKDIKRLNREEHRALKLASLPNSAFAAKTAVVPLAGLEFFEAARHYPILFIGEPLMPMALLGLDEERNVFVDAAGQWRANTYVPAFVRRYPFVLAQDSEEEFAVCFDAAYGGWNQNQGRALFAEDGAYSEFLEEMLGFLQSFSQEMVRTRAFMATLKSMGLLATRTLQLTHAQGESFTLENFQMVDEAKFLQLPDARVLELNRSGYLGWIYAHLMSLGNADQLFADFLARKAREGTTH